MRDAVRVFGQPPQRSPYLALVFAIMMALLIDRASMTGWRAVLGAH
jgi:hypothetical protein